MLGLRVAFVLMTVSCLYACAGCQAAYYGALERVGYHKRDILVDRVKDARDAQEDAKEQFESALEEFSAVLEYDGGELEDIYNRLNRELERSEKRAEAVHTRVDRVDEVSIALFREWEAELGEYENASLRRESARQLEQTRSRYSSLIRAMRKAESRIDPVLQPMRDQVLFLKHNLNAQAIASLQSEVRTIEIEVDSLIADMEAAIAEANSFIDALEEQG